MSKMQENIQFLIQQNEERFKDFVDMDGLFVARIGMGDETSIEVEGDPDEIIFSYMVDAKDSEEAYNTVVQELKNAGHKVYKNYEDFERRFHELDP